MVEVTMPKAGLSMEEGVLLKWLKSEGEQVHKGEPLFEIQTDKVSMEVEAPQAGTLTKLLAQEGEVIPVNQVIAWITEEGDRMEGPSFSFQSQQRTEPFIKASPSARRLAREFQIDLDSVTGTGPRGRIVQEDIRQYFKAKQSGHQEAAPIQPQLSVPDKEFIHLSGVRKVIAERMSASARTIPHVTLTTKADAGELKRFRENIRSQAKDSPLHQVTFTHLLARIVARALKTHSEVNVSLSEAGFIRHSNVNIGIAVDSEKGLMVPVLKNTDNLSLDQIVVQSRDLINRARSGTLKADDIRGGTFTISNLGAYEIDEFTPIINPPEAAILGIGRILESPWVVDGQVVPRPIMTLSLSFDHRVLDGGPAANFLRTVKRLIECPYLLV